MSSAAAASVFVSRKFCGCLPAFLRGLLENGECGRQRSGEPGRRLNLGIQRVDEVLRFCRDVVGDFYFRLGGRYILLGRFELGPMFGRLGLGGGQSVCEFLMRGSPLGEFLTGRCQTFGQSRRIGVERAEQFSIRSIEDAKRAGPVAGDETIGFIAIGDAQREIGKARKACLGRPLLVP